MLDHQITPTGDGRLTTPVEYLELVYDPSDDDLWLEVSEAHRAGVTDDLRVHLRALRSHGCLDDENTTTSSVFFIDTLLVDVLNALGRLGWVRQPPVREMLLDDLQRTLFARWHSAGGVDCDALRAA